MGSSEERERGDDIDCAVRNVVGMVGEVSGGGGNNAAATIDGQREHE